MEDYVTYEQAKALKELGFDWECNHYYQDNDKSFHQNFYENHSKHSRMRYKEDNTFIKVTLCSAPTLNQAQKWLREVRGIEVGVFADFDRELPNGKWMWLMRKNNTHLYDTVFPEDNINYDSYEQALSSGIDKALELLKQPDM